MCCVVWVLDWLHPPWFSSPPLFITGLHYGSGALQFFFWHYSPVAKPFDICCSRGMKRKNAQGIYRSKRKCFTLGLLMKAKEKKKKKMVILRAGPSPTHTIALSKSYRIQYITFSFTSLEL